MKLYNETEIGTILKRAAEMSHADVNSSGMGLSVEELQQLGAEAGLNPEFIIRAAAELHADKPKRIKNIFGGPVSYEREMVLDGEISASEWEEFLASIRSTFKDPGVVTTRENIFEWTVKSSGGSAQVTARTVDNTTRVNVFWNEPATAIPFMVPTIIGTIISLPITFEALDMSGIPGASVIVGTALTLFTLGRWGISHYTDRFSEKLDRMMTSFELIASKGELARNRDRDRERGRDQRTLETQETSAVHPLIDVEEALSEEENDTVRMRGRDKA